MLENQGNLIRGALKVKGITIVSIGRALKPPVTAGLIHHVIDGNTVSARCRAAIAAACDFTTWDEMLDSFPKPVERR